MRPSDGKTQEPADNCSLATMAGPTSEWNLKELLERLDGDEAFMDELLQIYLDDSKANLELARSGVAEANLDKVTRAAHTLKGMLRNLAMNRAAGAACVLETAGRQGNLEEVRRLLPNVEQQVAEVQPKVEGRLAGANK